MSILIEAVKLKLKLNRKARRRAEKPRKKLTGSRHTFGNQISNPAKRGKALFEAKNRLSLREQIELTRPLRDSNVFSRILWGDVSVSDYRPRENISAKPNDLRCELFWYAACFSINSAKINEFIKCRDSVTRAYFRGDYSSALGLLDEFETQLGKSVWGIEARLSILTRGFGHQKAQEFAKKITEAEENDSLIRFLTDQFVLRTDPDSTFEYQLNSLFFDRENSPSFDCYLKLRLCPSWTPDNEYILNCLRREWRLSIFDRYQLFLSVLSWVQSDLAVGFHIRDASHECAVHLVGEIRDSIISGIFPELALQSEMDAAGPFAELLDRYTTGNYKAIAEIESLGTDSVPFFPEVFELKARARMHLGLKLEINSSETPGEEIERLIQEMLSNERLEQGHEYRLLKAIAASSFCQRLSYLCKITATEYPAIFLKDVGEHVKRRSSLFCAPFNPRRFLDLDSMSQVSFENVLPSAIRGSVTFTLLKSTFGVGADSEEAISSLEIAPERKTLYSGYFRLHRGEHQKAIVAFDSLISSDNLLIRQDAIRGKADALLWMDSVEEAMDFAAETYIKEPRLQRFLRVADLIHRFEKKRPKSLAKKISLPIVTYIYSKEAQYSQSTRLAVRVEKFIKHAGVASPSEIAQQSNVFGKDETVFFLQEICTPETMQDIPFLSFDSPEKIQNERIQICSRIIELEPGSQKEMFEEITERLADLELRKGLRDVDMSRIHVDVDGIRRVLAILLEQLFQVYQALLKTAEIQLGARSYSIEDPETASVLVVPFRSQREFVRRGMILQIRDRFVSSNEFGLDCNLSMKVRHGKLETQLWRPLESAHLVTAQATDGTHKYNGHWADKFDEPVRSKVNGALATFSREIFDLISMLRDKWLQVRFDSSRPDALFDFRFFESDFGRIEEKLHAEMTTGDFIDSVIEDLWEKTEANLKVIEKKVRAEFSAQFDGAFERLLNSLGAMDTGDVSAEMIAKVAESRAISAREIEKIAGWFVRPQASLLEDFKLANAVHTSIAAMNRVRLSLMFSPELHLDDQIKAKGAAFRPFVDVLCTLFENALSKSEIEGRFPKVIVSLSRIETKIRLEVINEISSSAVTKENLAKIEKVRTEILPISIGGKLPSLVRKEGGTGFYKIVKTIRFDLRTSADIEIGFSGDKSTFRFMALIEGKELLV